MPSLLSQEAFKHQAVVAGIWDGLRLRGGEYSPRRRMPLVLRAPLRVFLPAVLTILKRL
jgi:hypothetical protein